MIVKIRLTRLYIERLLATWMIPEKRKWYERISFPFIFSGWINSIYLKEKDADIRENLKSLAMGGESGLAWAKMYLNRQICNTGINEDFYELLKGKLNISRKKVIIQIGSSDLPPKK